MNHSSQKPAIERDLLILFILFLLIAASQPAYGICQFVLKSSSEVSASRIVLGDLIAYDEHLSEQCNDHASIDLGPSPQSSRTMIVSQEEIKQILAQEIGAEEAQLSGAKNIKVNLRSVDVDQAKLLNFIQLNFDRILKAAKNYRVNIISVQLSNNIRLRPGYELVEIMEFHNKTDQDLAQSIQKLSNYQNFKIKYRYPDESQSDGLFTVRAQLELLQQVVVAKKDIGAGYEIFAEDFETSWLPYSRMSKKALSSINEIQGRVLKTALTAGSTLSVQNTVDPSAVKVGSLVDGLIKRGALRVNVKLKALNQGTIGQIIDVQNLQNRDRLRARVLARDKVEIL